MPVARQFHFMLSRRGKLESQRKATHLREVNPKNGVGIKKKENRLRSSAKVTQLTTGGEIGRGVGKESGELVR